METIQCCVYVCVPANDLVWQMMSREQTQTTRQPVHTNKQTEEMHKQADGRSGGGDGGDQS